MEQFSEVNRPMDPMESAPQRVRADSMDAKQQAGNEAGEWIIHLNCLMNK